MTTLQTVIFVTSTLVCGYAAWKILKSTELKPEQFESSSLEWDYYNPWSFEVEQKMEWLEQPEPAQCLSQNI